MIVGAPWSTGASRTCVSSSRTRCGAPACSARRTTSRATGASSRRAPCRRCIGRCAAESGRSPPARRAPREGHDAARPPHATAADATARHRDQRLPRRARAARRLQRRPARRRGVSRRGDPSRASPSARRPQCQLLLVDGGDEFQGTLASNLAFGRPIARIFNELGYAASALGNHEFDWGQDTLRARMRDAHYAFLGANVRYADGRDVPWIRDDTLIVRGPLKIGVIGLASVLTASTTHRAQRGRISGSCRRVRSWTASRAGCAPAGRIT